ncbi:lachesin-like [Aphis gossypii]|uniref:lachesin-like n=1 Tax=Aphis gossypii TaxID=80765 RepID=UPI002159AF04|nr:lachesin-like [Aphis gossypii]
MKNIYGVLLLLYITLAYSQKNPFIPPITQTLVRDIGGEVDLDCSTKHFLEFNVLWFKVTTDEIDTSILLSSGSTLIVKDPRVSLITEIKQDSSRFIIHINDIQEDDASIYRCDLIIGFNAEISYYTELLVRRPPFIYDNSTKSLVVEEGQSVQLACFAGGYPTPRIFWRKPNNAILTIGNILKIPAIQKEDRGTYYCIAENGVGKGTRRRISIEVEFPPVVTVLQTRVGQAVNYDVYLECHVESNPPPALIWMFNGVQLSNNKHYLISDFATADDKIDSRLQIIKIKNYLYGDYICQAANNLETAEITITVFETVLPQCPPVC